ncbi:hypothetical protein [Peribacillus deserti]|uniref:Uncharacterized protein n=1 Tax=Peribacillus deserti TaxID=673318 RepID=A0A2N5M3D9_9BACI|nr:hypothetical protein [Peribacillus deserti]PLT28884.1 hypothetical protein CUU66_16185 [Peribacillus deserti]
MKIKDKVLESILWSIALPGFSQLLNGRLFKGTLFMILEFLININAHFNEIILLSFLGKIEEANARADYQWLMFYPCLYFFAMWDAFKEAGGGKKPYAYLPFVLSAYFVTTGIMFSARVKIYGVLLGSMWFPMLCVVPGLAVGFALKWTLNKL